MAEKTEKFIVSSSPHIHDKMSTRRIMLEVIIALMPALVMGVVFFGLYALLIVLLSVGAALLGEFLYNVIVKKKQTIGDLSAVVTGLILGLCLPPAVPFYVPIAGGLLATMLVKMLFGGLGKNFVNPAATARIFLMLTWAAAMTTYVTPLTYAGNDIFSELTKYFGGFFSVGGLDGLATSTPLSGKGDMNLMHLLLGNVSGSIGETSALALIIGGVYLIVRKIIDYKIPLIYIGTFVFFTLIFTGSYIAVLPELLSGGLMLGAFFMATDYTTSPNTKCGTIIYAIGLGFLTVLLRQLTAMPEGACYSIVLMNLVVPLLDKGLVPIRFGSRKKPALLITLTSILGAMVVTIIAFVSTSFALDVSAVNKFGGESYSVVNVISKRPNGEIENYYNGQSSTVFRVRSYGGEDSNGEKGYVTALVKIEDSVITKIEIATTNQGKDSAAFSSGYLLGNFIGKSLAVFTVGDNVTAPSGDNGQSATLCAALTRVYEFTEGV